MALFEEGNPFHPNPYAIEAMKIFGIEFIVPISKKGADDMAIKRKLNELVGLRCDPSEVCVVLIANDKDYADEV